MDRELASTRNHILKLLRTRGGMTANALAGELHITAMGVRRHLSVLEREEHVQIEMQRRQVGRPTFVYTLTEHAQDLFPKNYHTLANQFLDAVQEQSGENAVQSLFDARMNLLLKQYRPRMDGKQTLADRIAELAKIQDEAGYMAVWEKTANGFLLKEQNCAIYRIACRFQEACQFEIELFKQLLDADITRVEHQVKGDRTCTYLVRERKAASPSRAKPTQNLPRRKLNLQKETSSNKASYNSRKTSTRSIR